MTIRRGRNRPATGQREFEWEPQAPAEVAVIEVSASSAPVVVADRSKNKDMSGLRPVMLSMFLEGKNSEQIGRSLGVHPWTVRKHLRASGIDPNRSLMADSSRVLWGLGGKGTESIRYISVPDWDGYRVGEDGTVWTCREPSGRNSLRWRELARSRCNGYFQVTLSKNRSRKLFKMSRLVLEVFVGPPLPGMQSCHNNGIRSDDRLSNLRWDTPLNNSRDKKKHGTHLIGTGIAGAVLDETKVAEIKAMLVTRGYSVPLISRKYGVSQPTVSSIKNNRHWLHVPWPNPIPEPDFTPPAVIPIAAVFDTPDLPPLREPLEYRDIPDAPGYRARSDGSIWSSRRTPKASSIPVWQKLKSTVMPNGRHIVTLHVSGESRINYVHRLVLAAFRGPAKAGQFGCHYPDPDPANNRIDNLRWDSPKANVLDALKLGRFRLGSRHPQSVLDERKVWQIKAILRYRQSLGHDIMRFAELGKRFGVSVSTICNIWHGKVWNHVLVGDDYASNLSGRTLDLPVGKVDSMGGEPD